MPALFVPADSSYAIFMSHHTARESYRKLSERINRFPQGAPPVSLATTRDRGQFANPDVTSSLRESTLPSARRPPSPVDFYLSWISPNLSYFDGCAQTCCRRFGRRVSVPSSFSLW